MLVLEELTRVIIAACIEVHRNLGAGLLESSYEACVCEELRVRGVRWQRQVALPIKYKGITLVEGYRIDLLVEGQVIVEIKAVESLQPIHEAQVLTYLKHTGLRVALLVNFNVPVLKDGIKRFVL